MVYAGRNEAYAVNRGAYAAEHSEHRKISTKGFNVVILWQPGDYCLGDKTIWRARQIRQGQVKN